MVDPILLAESTANQIAANTDAINSLWLIVAAALVLIMTPGVAFFYGGMARAKNTVSMMMLTFGSMCLVGVLWVLYGYSMAFSSGKDWLIPHVLGNPFASFGLQNMLGIGSGGAMSPDLKSLAFVGFQATFAIITVSLITGALAARAKFGAFMVFTGFWVTLVYFPVASWVFNFTAGSKGLTDGGWIVYGLGVNDFAGGTAVHINAGAAALAIVLVLGKRKGFSPDIPGMGSNKALALLGATLLWFGWFGFNAGSEAAVDGIAAVAWVNTLVAPAAAGLAWAITEKLRKGKTTSIGVASGIVAGLVAITPACNILTPLWAIVLGLLAGAVCSWAIDQKYKLGYDDSLDVVGVHFVGGWIGTLYIGIFGQGIGLISTGSFTQLGAQFLGAASVTVWSFGISWLIAFIIDKTMGFRIPPEVEEGDGIDVYLHGEVAYVRD
ncbi:MAG: ammonium transporter [Pseudoclavibacter sp.]|jgi:Amt family ammonium transporter